MFNNDFRLVNFVWLNKLWIYEEVNILCDLEFDFEILGSCINR